MKWSATPGASPRSKRATQDWLFRCGRAAASPGGKVTFTAGVLTIIALGTTTTCTPTNSPGPSLSLDVTAAGGSTAPDTTPASDLTPAQSRIVEEIKGQVAGIRGLAWKGSLPVKVVSKDALAERVRKLNAEEIAENREELTADESVLKLLKLLEKDVDYAKTIDSILAGGVLGFYDDEVKELYVGSAGDNLDPATRATLAHELTHALTDQHFDFGTRTKALDDQNKTEEAAAFSALIEGDAELVAALWQEKHLTARERQQAAAGPSPEALNAYARAPRYLLESLFFPYQSGATFVQTRHRAGGVAPGDTADRHPPHTTPPIRPPAAEAGFDAHLTKPVDMERLLGLRHLLLCHADFLGAWPLLGHAALLLGVGVRVQLGGRRVAGIGDRVGDVRPPAQLHAVPVDLHIGMVIGFLSGGPDAVHEGQAGREVREAQFPLEMVLLHDAPARPELPLQLA